VLRREVHVGEVRVDLRAAEAAGLHPPVPFLAGVDVLRGGARGGGLAPAPGPDRGARAAPGGAEDDR
jgi:hypothetical protein